MNGRFVHLREESDKSVLMCLTYHVPMAYKTYINNFQDKCYHYWPHDREPMFYGDLQVQIVRKTRDKEHEEPEFITTQMTISQVFLWLTVIISDPESDFSYEVYHPIL